MERRVRTFEMKEGEDTRDQSRFHVKMVMGTQYVSIVDTKFKPVVRAMKLDVSPETISESNFLQIFEEVTEALSQSGNIADDESASCITYPEGTVEVDVPLPEGLN
jgi:hypothetical protein